MPDSDSARPLHLYKALVWVLVAIAAVVVWGVSGPDLSPERDFGQDVLVADANYEVNNGRTEGAPQQQVVNGWYVRELLPILAAQNSVIIERSGVVSTLLLVFGLGVCADVIGSSLLRSRRPATAVEEHGAVVPRSSFSETQNADQVPSSGSPMSEPPAPPNVTPPTP